ncbi:hypothetical protein RKE30_14410 [Streptomyces sp. Li-HN-5-11]|uniref:hypothetical protein n=1 Tax=Streptomyces sp. Li-HN-5-11 TaxID=3075432 RepID=UPI0028AF49CE|nr:hypothetical protein [Streptomyces sp. Li-HN-5-11]WNM31516.1 hypothetical protein RKE30_14410 [Streptomyces sp. Li-HN-5-11]
MKRQLAALGALLGALVLGAPAAFASGAPQWTQTGTAYHDSLTGGEGVASRADGSLLYRGLASVPLDLRVKGWNHVGDPDIAGGYVFDAYQGADTATSKMFEVTTPSGKRYDYVHPLDAGEKLNNSFAAVSPDAQWLVSGEWGDQNRLQVFPAPLLNPSTPATGGTLAQAGQITLDKAVADIQGCDFVSDTRLLCASDDASGTHFPEVRPLLQVDLPHRLNGQPVSGTVTSLFALPEQSVCSGTFETEGIDYDAARGTLRVEVVQPGVCEVSTTVYSYRLQ